MKRWMVRLAALSTVVLAALVLFAHGYRGGDRKEQAEKLERRQGAEPAIKPIPLAAEPEITADRGDPFANRPRFVEQARPSETSNDRYAQPTSHEEPAAGTSAELQEPRRLDALDNAPDDAPDNAALLPVARSPAAIRAADHAQNKSVTPTAITEPADSSEAVAPAVAGPAEALTTDADPPSLTEPGPAEQSHNGNRYGRPSVNARVELPSRAADAAGLENVAESSADTSAFASPAGREARFAASPGNGRPGDRQLEGIQSPSLVIEKRAPAEIQVGKPVTILIHVRNAGQVAASGVEIHDSVPQGAELVSTKPSAVDDGGKLVWQLGTLTPNDETTVEMQVMPITEGEIGSVASVSFSAQASARSKVTRPQLKLEATAPKKVLIGESATLRIRVSNPGSGPATGVVLTEEVPEGFKHEGGKRLEFEVGKLAPGESREMELSMIAVQPGIVTNQLTADGDANLHAADQAEIEVIAPALKVGLQGPKRRYLQRNATYTVSVANPGTAPAKSIELVATLPRGLKFVEANNAGQYDATAHTIIWSLDELPAGESGTVTLTTLAVEPGDLKLQIAGKAAMGLADSLEEEVAVEGVAAIFFELVDVNDPIEVGGETTYEIRVINQGSAAASGVRLVALLPPELKALDAAGPVSHTIEPGRVLFEPLTQLAPKADTMYTLRVQGTAAGDLRLKVQIVTDQITNPVTKEESTRVYSDE